MYGSACTTFEIADTAKHGKNHTSRYVSSHLSDQSFVLFELIRFRVHLIKFE